MLQVSVHCRQFRQFESNCSCIWNRSLSLALWATRLVHWLARPTGMSFAIVWKLGESGTLVVLSRSKVYTKQNENWSKKLGKNKKIKEVGPKNKTLEEIYFPSQNVLLPSAAMVLQLAMLILYRSEVRGGRSPAPFHQHKQKDRLWCHNCNRVQIRGYRGRNPSLWTLLSSSGLSAWLACGNARRGEKYKRGGSSSNGGMYGLSWFRVHWCGRQAMPLLTSRSSCLCYWVW